MPIKRKPLPTAGSSWWQATIITTDRPGHIAIVRTGNKTAEQIAAEGPDVIQAGAVNKTSISVKDAFAGHPAAWRDHEIAYYAHEVKP